MSVREPDHDNVDRGGRDADGDAEDETHRCNDNKGGDGDADSR